MLTDTTVAIANRNNLIFVNCVCLFHMTKFVRCDGRGGGGGKDRVRVIHFDWALYTHTRVIQPCTWRAVERGAVDIMCVLCVSA